MWTDCQLSVTHAKLTVMSELLAALDGFLREHRRCDELDGGVEGEGEHIWMSCECGPSIVRPRAPFWLPPGSTSPESRGRAL